MDNNLVVVLSRNYPTGLSVVRSLGAAGYTVDLVANANRKGASSIAASSKYVRNAVEIVSKKVKNGNDYGILDALLAYKGQCDYKIPLFPTDDYTASIMDYNREILSGIFVMPEIIGGEAGSMSAAMDKTVQGEYAKIAGLTTPMAWTISLEGDIEIPEDMVYPCFCKPLESITGYKTEMAKCEDAEALITHLTVLQNNFANRSVLVQEYLEVETEIDFSGVALDQEVIIPAIIRKTNVAQFEKGVTLAGVVVPFEELGEDLMNQIKTMIQQFHYRGMFDMEFMVANGKCYFNEVNLRSGGPNYAYFASGVNLPALFVKEALGEKHTPEEEKVDTYGKHFIYEKVAWDDHMHGFMTKRQLDKAISEADITLLCNEDDPVPGEVFTERMKKQTLRRKKAAIKEMFSLKNHQIIHTVLSTIKHYVLRFPQTKRKNRRNPNADRPRVLVAGRNYCSNLCMAKSVGAAGYEVEVMKLTQIRFKRRNFMKWIKPDAYSKFVKAYYHCVSYRNPHRIVKFLIDIADLDNKMLLIPADDLMACVVDENYDLLKNYYILPNVDDKQGEISRLMNKDVQKELAEKAGLPVLHSCVIKSHAGEFEIPDSVTYPCFIKPNVSKNASKSFMRKCENKNELYTALATFARKHDFEMLVEDYVEIKTEISMLGVSTKAGATGPGFFAAEYGGQAEHRGVALVGRILPPEVQKDLRKDIVDFVSTLKFDGLFDVDLVETTDGRIIFVELNLRFGASGFAVDKCGVNLPGMFADYMIFNKPVDLDCQVTTPGKLFVSDRVLLDEYVMNRISWETFNEILNGYDIHFIKDPDDMSPYRHFRRYFLLAKYARKKQIEKTITAEEKKFAQQMEKQQELRKERLRKLSA